MRAATAIVRVTLRQLLGLRRVLGLGLLSVGPGAIFLLTSGSLTPGQRLETLAGISAAPFFAVAVPIIALIMATAALGNERRDRTLSFLAVRPVPRWVITASKYAASAIAASGISGAGAVVMAGTLGVRDGNWSLVLPLVAGAIVATLAYTALFLPLGYLTERATLVGLAFVFIWESAIVGTISGLAASSPWRIGYSAFAGLAGSELLAQGGEVFEFALGDLAPGAGGAAAKVAVLAAIGIGSMALLLRRRDLV